MARGLTVDTREGQPSKGGGGSNPPHVVARRRCRMSGMAVVIWIVSVVLYGLIGSFMGGKSYPGFERRHSHSDMFSAGGQAALVGAFWPIGVMVLLGMWVASGEMRRQQEREADLAERERLLKLGMDELKREGLA